MTFTYKEGLCVQILPNGSVQQTICETKKSQGDDSEVQEAMRTVTRECALIKELKDGNQVIYLKDGTITKTDHRRGIWTTTNPEGVVRERNVRTGIV